MCHFEVAHTQIINKQYKKQKMTEQKQPLPVEGIVEKSCLHASDWKYKLFFRLTLRVNNEDYNLPYDSPIRIDIGERVRIWSKGKLGEKGTCELIGGDWGDVAVQVLDKNGREKFCYKYATPRNWNTQPPEQRFLDADLDSEYRRLKTQGERK